MNGEPSEFSRLASALAIWLAVLFHANGTVAVCPAALTTFSRKSPTIALVHHENVPFVAVPVPAEPPVRPPVANCRLEISCPERTQGLACVPVPVTVTVSTPSRLPPLGLVSALMAAAI
jgi:hypothetical protein